MKALTSKFCMKIKKTLSLIFTYRRDRLTAQDYLWWVLMSVLAQLIPALVIFIKNYYGEKHYYKILLIDIKTIFREINSPVGCWAVFVINTVVTFFLLGPVIKYHVLRRIVFIGCIIGWFFYYSMPIYTK